MKLMAIRKLKDIEVYSEALKLASEIYGLVKGKRLAKEFSLVDQIKRASLSVAANIAEGYGRNTTKEFAQYLSIARGSTNEVITFLDFIQLEFGIDTSELMKRYDTLARRIYTFRKYLLSKPK